MNISMNIKGINKRASSAEKTYTLSDESIQEICGLTSSFFLLHKANKKEVLRVSLLLEEMLLNYKERLSEEALVTFRVNMIFGIIRAVITVKGEPFDPFEMESLTDRSIMGLIMAEEGVAQASWEYKAPNNEIVFTARREHKLNSIARIGIGILCGFMLGFLMCRLPVETARNIVSAYITPVTGAFTGLLCVMAAPLCFFASALGIVRMGDVSSFGAVVKKMKARMALIALLSAFIGAIGVSSMHIIGSRAILISGLHKLVEILISFVPTNILSPFLEFNSVQIIILGVMVGASLLAIGQKGDNVVELFDSLNSVAITCNTVFLNRFIPYYVMLTIISVVCTRQIAVAPELLRMTWGILVGELLILLFNAAAVYICLRISLRVFFRKMTPPFLIALSSASFAASYSENIDSLLSLGVEPNFASLVYNIGGIIFRPGECVIFTAFSLYMANYFNVEVSWIWLLTAFVLSFVLTTATPPVPGGIAVSLAILFSQLGFPREALTLVIPLSMVLEYPTVAIDAFCAKCQILLLSRLYRKIDLGEAGKA